MRGTQWVAEWEQEAWRNRMGSPVSWGLEANSVKEPLGPSGSQDGYVGADGDRKWETGGEALFSIVLKFYINLNGRKQVERKKKCFL